jgi:phage gpG-like protein
MSGVGITTTGDWSKFEKALHRLARLNWLGLHQEIGEALVSSTHQRWRRGTDPEGQKWPRAARGGQTLRHKSILYKSIGYQAHATHVEVGTNDKRARVHQEGLTIKGLSQKQGWDSPGFCLSDV